MTLLLLEFIACACAIVFSGVMLSRYGDAIAEKTGMGRMWIGLILIAGVTSLPELITGISSVTVAGVPDIAVGDIMGSCVFNIAIIALMDLLSGPGPIFSSAEHGHIISAGFGIVLIGIAAVSVFLGNEVPSAGSIGFYTPLMILVYFVGIRSVYSFEKRKLAQFVGEAAHALRYDHISMRRAVTGYSLNALVVIIAAAFLPFIGGRLADATGLGKSFVGTSFVAMTTSLPELVISIASLKIGAADMAIANLFGSNMFNMLILAIDDIFYRAGPLLEHVSGNHVITGFMAIIMTGVAIIALTYRLAKKTFLRMGWDAIALLLAYAANLLLLFSLRKG